MFERLDSPKHLIAGKITGDLTADDIVAMNKLVDEALKSNGSISFYAEIDKTVKLTFDGLIKDFIDGISRLGQLNRFYRAAVVTDRGWVAAVARIEGLVFYSMDIRAFSFEDKAKAFAWAAEEPEEKAKPAEPGPGIHFLQTTNDAVFAYEVTGRILEKDITRTVDELNRLYDSHEKINILAKMGKFSGFDITAFLNDNFVKAKFRSFSKVDKYAVIGAKPWMRNFLELVDPLFAVKIKVFDAEDEQAAWDWIGSSQALLAES